MTGVSLAAQLSEIQRANQAFTAFAQQMNALTELHNRRAVTAASLSEPKNADAAEL